MLDDDHAGPSGLGKNDTANPQQPSITTSEQTIASPATKTAIEAPASVKPATPSKKKKIGLMVGLVSGLVVLLGGGAGAYYGVIAPNKPENVLKTALSNTLNQNKIQYDGKLSYESTDKNSSVKAVNASFKGAADLEASAYSSIMEVTASGVKIPLEVRLVEKNLYAKIGDLSTLKGLVQSASPEYAALVEELNKKLANQWLEIDETLLKQMKADCALDTNLTLTKDDIALIEKRYQEIPFARVKSDNDETLNGRTTIKYELELDNNKGAEFGKDLNELSIVKKLKNCDPQVSKLDSNKLENNGTTPITIWVDKASKQIVKLAGKSSPQDEQKNKFKADFEVTMQYGQVSISKPEGSKPLMEVVGDLRQMLEGGNTPVVPQNTRLNNSSGNYSPECIRQLQEYSRSNFSIPPPDCV